MLGNILTDAELVYTLHKTGTRWDCKQKSITKNCKREKVVESYDCPLSEGDIAHKRKVTKTWIDLIDPNKNGWNLKI